MPRGTSSSSASKLRILISTGGRWRISCRVWSPTRWPKLRINHRRADWSLLLAACAALALCGCRQDMHDQPKYKYLRPTEFFPDGRSARPLVENTVARGHLEEDSVFYTGMVEGPRGPEPTTEIPIEVTRQVLDRGQERFNIFCSPCHGQL